MGIRAYSKEIVEWLSEGYFYNGGRKHESVKRWFIDKNRNLFYGIKAKMAKRKFRFINNIKLRANKIILLIRWLILLVLKLELKQTPLARFLISVTDVLSRE